MICERHNLNLNYHKIFFIEFPTFFAVVNPLLIANTEGPEPEIPHPRAPVLILAILRLNLLKFWNENRS